jgi:N-acetylneuraminic acid mutarotase
VAFVGSIGGTRYNRIYDPLTDTWDSSFSATPVPEGMGFSAAALDGNLIYVAGRGDFAPLVYRYDTVNNTWSRLSDLPVPLEGAMGAAVRGKFYVVGGITVDGNNNGLLRRICGSVTKHSEGSGLLCSSE